MMSLHVICGLGPLPQSKILATPPMPRTPPIQIQHFVQRAFLLANFLLKRFVRKNW